MGIFYKEIVLLCSTLLYLGTDCLAWSGVFSPSHCFYAPETRSRGHINLPLSVRPFVRPSGLSGYLLYSFGATALIFCMMFIHIMEVSMSTF